MNARLHELEKLYERTPHHHELEEGQIEHLLKIYKDLVVLLSEASSLQFNTLFARVSFIVSRHPMGHTWSYALQILRREIHRRELSDDMLLPILHATIQYLVLVSRAILDGADISIPLRQLKIPDLPRHRRPGKFKKKFARVVVMEWDKANQLLHILDEDEPDTQYILEYHVAGINDIFSETLELALTEIGIPLILGLVDVDCTESKHYVPGYIVIVPDLLLDVTAVTQVVTGGSDPLALNVMDIFLPSSSTEAILIGQVANYFLDELVRDPSQSFQSLFAGAFNIYPFEFVRLSDEQVRDMQKRLKMHYENILKVIDERFPALGIDRKECVIEPTYFSPQFGIKGRLDLYHEPADKPSSSIIELKSNRPFKPNSYGLSSPNYHQTLLYDLLIQSSHGPKHHRANYILYSGEVVDPLRYAASVEAIQKETIQNRNQLALLQFRLMSVDQASSHDLFCDITPQNYESIKGYQRKHIETWHSVYSSLAPGEQNYFRSFTAFITREHMVARIGNERGEGSSGLASLWLDNAAIKEERYELFQRLELLSVEQDTHQTIIKFLKTEKTNPLANFRSGDIAVLYPYKEGEELKPTQFQLHRASVLSVDARHVVIRLRNAQVHTEHLEKTRQWNLEHDLLDSSFRVLYQSLWQLFTNDPLKRQVILGLTPSISISSEEMRVMPKGLTSNQELVYREAINAGFLYLLWGPPGTGKTSVMLRSWVWYYFTQTPSRIALLAYTNKAVDEICDALDQSGPEIKDHYIRIGSRAATGEAFRHRLLDNLIKPMTRRSEIKDMLDQTRIFVSTISSFLGKNEIFNLVSFDVAIVDEASQLLEPGIVGLLTRFGKAILIGDHMQLPAVSVQPERYCRIQPEQDWNKRIGLTTMSMSYFERMHRHYQARGWNHVIGTLFEQGRMHDDIMKFANQYVYQDHLRIVDEKSQLQMFEELFPDDTSELLKSRLIYLCSEVKPTEKYQKTNQSEAAMAIELITFWRNKIVQQNLPWTIGVITPFRAQIAAIIHLGHEKKVDLSQVSIDTVERYQGGAKDIIIMSCAANSLSTLSKITSVNADGVDRKLNVAVTRARQQFILLGSDEILKTEPAYRALMAMSKIIKPDAIETERVLNYQADA